MTYDLIQTFKQIFKDDKVVLDSYKMDAGYYYLAKKDGTLQRLIVNRDNDSDDYELYKYLKVRDFYSKYLNSNKAIDTGYTEVIGKTKYSMLKKICSNNMYTLFFKNKFVEGLCNADNSKDSVNLEIFKKGINKYYESLGKLGSSKEEKILLSEFYNKEELENAKNKMINAFSLVYSDFMKEDNKPKETWIKIFLEEGYDEYIKSANIYLTLKLFNTNSNNIKVDDEIYGVNNYNYGLNSKKPYLELKSTPYKVSSLISKEDVNILNNMYKWLYNNGVSETVLKLPREWDFKGIATEKSDILNKDLYLIKVAGNNGVARVDDFQYITNFTTKIREFVVNDTIRKVGNEFKTENIYGLEFYTSNTWIANNSKCEKNYLKDSYYDFENKVSKSIAISNWKKDFLKQNATIFFELFQKEDETNFVHNLNKFGVYLIENTIIEELEKNKQYISSPFNSINTMNLWIAYKKYFCKEGEVDEEMKINNVQEECFKILQDNKTIQTDEQYYFLAGQIAFYLLTQSKASKLTQDMTAPFVKAGNLKKLKDELRCLYEKYNYELYLQDDRFNNIFSQLLLQEPDTSVKDNKDLILAGMLSSNMFYAKKEDK